MDQACREIRHGRLTRAAALSLVNKYQSVAAPNINLFLEWTGISKNGLDLIIKEHSKKKAINAYTDSHAYISDGEFDLSFIPNDSLKRKDGAKMIIIGKGYPD